jgi:uncharacterized protein with HEPN domain
MKEGLGDKARIQHIIMAIDLVLEFTKNCDFITFSTHQMMLSASLRQLEIIGEASNAVSNELQSKHPEIDWSGLIGLRNIIIHRYFGVSEKVIWDIIEYDLVSLRKKFDILLHAL